MFVRKYMTKPVITVSAKVVLPEARRIMDEGGFRHLPVVGEGNRLEGIITDRDIRSASPTSLANGYRDSGQRDRFSRTTAGEIMTAAVHRLNIEATLDDALIVFDRTGVGALPVVENGERVVGILSIRNLLAAFREIFGLGEPGSSLLAVRDDGESMPLARFSRLLETARVDFSRIIMLPGPGEESGRVIYARINTHNTVRLRELAADAGFIPIFPL